jgi:hypothetical protein
LTSDLRIVLGIILGALVALAVLTVLLYPYVFRFLVLPPLAKRFGWRIRRPVIAFDEHRDLPGDGSQGWETPIPGTSCEFLGVYGGRPVHGVEVTITLWRRAPGQLPRASNVWRYTVISVATSDRPFEGFNAPHRGTVMNGDPMACYADFQQWARNRRVQDRKGVLEEAHGLRSVSWQGWMTRRKVLAALDRLTAQTTG